MLAQELEAMLLLHGLAEEDPKAQLAKPLTILQEMPSWVEEVVSNLLLKSYLLASPSF
jgi:hypothetical protein